jgi:hypothetical protein
MRVAGPAAWRMLKFSTKTAATMCTIAHCTTACTGSDAGRG